MVVFIYDNTFEGVLTALFDAYSRKQFPELLITEAEPIPLFSEINYRVRTDRQRSQRVWSGFADKVERRVCNMVMSVWLSELPERGGLIFRYMKKIFDHGSSYAYNFADMDVLEIKKIAMKVSHEGHYLMEFVRFQKAADGTFFSPVSPKYNALPLAVNYFRSRFADQQWMIYDTRRRYGYYYDLKQVKEITLDSEEFMEGGRLDDKLMAADERQFQELWKTYFNALAIKERINPKLHSRNMPRRFWKYLTEKQ